MFENRYCTSINNAYDQLKIIPTVGTLQEIQQYRAIGTVEEIKKVVQFLSMDNDNGIIKDLQLLNKYQIIGTVRECQEAMEKQKVKNSKIKVQNADLKIGHVILKQEQRHIGVLLAEKR